MKDPKKNIALANLSIYYTWKNIQSEYNNNKVKISPPTWNYTFDLPNGFYSIADIQNYSEFVMKKHETLTENPPVFSLEFLTPETMKLFGSTKKKIHSQR